MSILAVLEQRGGAWNRMSFETLAAAQQFAQQMNTTASAAVVGGSGCLRQLARRKIRAAAFARGYPHAPARVVPRIAAGGGSKRGRRHCLGWARHSGGGQYPAGRETG